VSPFAALHGLRVGCVQYLNARPLIVPYDGEVIYEHPARLADMLAAGKIDMALIPVFEALRQPEFPIADGAAIASRGAVYSVFLAHVGPVEELKVVTLDPASRTSNNLARCILAEFYGIEPEYTKCCETMPDATRGVVLIGDQAIRFRQQHGDAVRYLDMGEEWLKRTGLPFVYAAWQMRPECEDLPVVAKALRAIKMAGVARVKDIARLQRGFDAGFAERYLTQYIRFDLGEREKAGLARFRGLLQKHGLIPASDVPVRFV
jgi:chorismate dehydratase